MNNMSIIAVQPVVYTMLCSDGQLLCTPAALHCRFMELKQYIKERRDALANTQPGQISSKKSQKGFA